VLSPHRPAEASGLPSRIVTDRGRRHFFRLAGTPPQAARPEKSPGPAGRTLAMTTKGVPAMPMQDEHRRAYLKRAGVTTQQIDQTVGDLPIHEASYRAPGVSADRAGQIRDSLRQVIGDASIIAAKYSAIAGGEPAASISAAEQATDQRHLEELFAPEYQLHNPFGAVEDREHVIEAMLKGMISYDGMGGRGFESVHQSLQILGDSAIVTGDYRLRASSRATRIETGEVFQKDLDGTYRITTTYALRDGLWQAISTQMTRVPEDRQFVLTPEN
jgi:hypothetical protein